MVPLFLLACKRQEFELLTMEKTKAKGKIESRYRMSETSQKTRKFTTKEQRSRRDKATKSETLKAFLSVTNAKILACKERGASVTPVALTKRKSPSNQKERQAEKMHY